MANYGTYVKRGSLWYQKGYPAFVPSGVDDGFMVGVTEATEANTGVLADVTRELYVGPSLIDGTSDPDFPLLIVSKDINKLLTVRSGYVKFLNCLFTGGPGTFDTGQVDCRAAGVLRVTFERCDFIPAATSYYLNAVIGHHMTVYRCYAERIVDFVGSYNTHAARTDNFVWGNYVKNFVRYDVDHAHTDGTHNDFVQHQGGIGLSIKGNTALGYNRYPDGTVPTDLFRLSSQFAVIQENVAIGGVYYCGEVEVSANRISGFMHVVSIKTRNPDADGGRAGTPYDATAVDNLLLNDDQRYYGSTAWEGGIGRPYIFRTGTETTINGVTTVPTDGQPYDLGGNNRYANTLAVTRASLRGELVSIRRDNFAGG